MRSSKSPPPIERVCGMPKSGPNTSILSAYRRKRARMPIGRPRIPVSTRLSKNVTRQVTRLSIAYPLWSQEPSLVAFQQMRLPPSATFIMNARLCAVLIHPLTTYGIAVHLMSFQLHRDEAFHSLGPGVFNGRRVHRATVVSRWRTGERAGHPRNWGSSKAQMAGGRPGQAGRLSCHLLFQAGGRCDLDAHYVSKDCN